MPMNSGCEGEVTLECLGPALLPQDVVGVVDTAEQYRARLAVAASAPPDQRLPEAETTAGDLQKCGAPCFEKGPWSVVTSGLASKKVSIGNFCP